MTRAAAHSDVTHEGTAPRPTETIVARLERFRAEPDVAECLTLLHDGAATQTISCHELIDRARAVAAHLRERSTDGDVVIVLPHGIDAYAAFLGALGAGCTPSLWAPPSPKVSRAQYNATLAHQLATVQPAAVIAEMAPDGLSAERFIDVAQIAEQSHVPLGSDARPDDVAFLQYSSGTTGAKKAVALTHSAALWNIDRYAQRIGLDTSRDRIVSWLPLYHDMGLIACFLMPILHRVPLVALCPFEWVRRPARWLEAITQYQGTLGWLPNFAYAFLADRVPEDALSALDLRSLRGVVNCSEPVRIASHERFLQRFGPCGLRNTALAVSYAMAESTFAVTSGGFDEPLRLDRVDDRRFTRDGVAAQVDERDESPRVLVSCGTALPETSIAVVDPEGKPLAERVIGEIVIDTPGMGAYITDRTRCLSSFATGDLGYLAEGHLFVTGRKKDLLIIHGVNLWPDDVEAAACSVSGIVPGRACAIGLENAALGTQDLVVVAETTNPELAARDALAAAVRTSVAAQTEVTPTDVRIVDHRWLEKTSSGKMARIANRSRYLEAFGHGHEAPRDLPAPDAQVKSRVLAVMRRAMRCDMNSSASLQHDAAMDSLELAGVIAGLENEFGIRFDASVLSEPAAMASVDAVEATVERLLQSRGGSTEPIDIPLGRDAVTLTGVGSEAPARASRFWTMLFRFRCQRLGIQLGRNVSVYGPVLLRIDGTARNITIGNNVTIMPGVDLKVRENGRIILHDGVALDTNARLVAAREGTIEMGERAQLAMGSIINAGADVIIGCRTATAANCTIASSEHLYMGADPIMEQGYRHEPILIGSDVWLGAGVFVGPGSRIGDGAVIGVGGVVRGDIPARAVFVGNPGRVIRYRAKAAAE